MHTAESLFGIFEPLLQTKRLPVNGWDFIRLHCSRVICVSRAGMKPGLHENRDAEDDEHRWSLRFDSRDSYPQRNRAAIRGAIHILLHDRFGISLKDIPSEALAELELRLEVLMLGDGSYVPFAELCDVAPSLALARALPLSVARVRFIRPKHPSERHLERHAVALAKMHGVLRAELGH
jgi:hypothetical protein